MFKNYLRICLGLAILLGTTMFAKEVVITIWANADQSERYRVENIKTAAQILNEEYIISGIDIQVKVKTKVYSGGAAWSKMKQAFTLAADSGSGPEIILGGHEDIAIWGKSGLIRKIENYVDLDSWPLNNVIPSLWKIVSWNGGVWGIPQDAEARPFFAWNAHLKAIGYSKEKIASFRQDVKSGKFTLYKMLEEAKKMQDKGLVKKGFGFYPRISKGGDYWQSYKSFGGELYNDKLGKLIITKAALKGYYQFFYDAVYTYKVTKKSHIGTEWNDWYKAVSFGKVGFWHGGTWHYKRYITENKKLKFFKEISFSLIPAGNKIGKANTLTHPLVYLISSKGSEETAQIAAQLISIATEPRLNTLHAIASAHLGVTLAQADIDIYSNDKWTASVSGLLKSAFAQPNSANFSQYDAIVWKGLMAVWSGDQSPDEAVSLVINCQVSPRCTISKAIC